MDRALQPVVPIDHLLLDNQLPPERDTLLRLLETIAQKDAELKKWMEVATARRAEYASYAKNLTNALAPCRIVPADIWSLIFCLIPESCWRISWVCRAWRQIALSTPFLWTTIAEFTTNGASRDLNRARQRLQARCSRAGSRPFIIDDLRLPIERRRYRNEYDLIEFQAVFHAMVPRVERIRVDANRWTLSTVKSLSASYQRFHRLKSIELDLSVEETRDKFGHVRLFRFSPNLSHVTLKLGPRLAPFTTWLNIPMNNLTSLYVMWMSLEDFYNILESATVLNHLLACIDDQSLEDEISRVRQPQTRCIQHNHLRRLTLVFQKSRDHMDVLSLLDLPMVQELFIRTLQDELEPDSSRRVAAPGRFSTCALPHLTLLFIGRSQARYCNSTHVMNLLHLSSSIEHLSLPWDENISQLFSALVTPTFLPMLTSLHVFDIPQEVLEEDLSTEEWHIDINHVVRSRSLRQEVQGSEGLHVFLSSMPHEWLEESVVREGIVACLNESAAFLSRLDSGEDNDDLRLDAEDEYLEPIRELINQINKPFCVITSRNDVVSRTLEQLSMLQKAVERLAHHPGALERCAISLLPALAEEIPAELLSLPDLMEDEESRYLAESLLERWRQLQREYLDSPGWNVLEGGHEYYNMWPEYRDLTVMWIRRNEWPLYEHTRPRRPSPEEQGYYYEGDVHRQTPWVVYYAATKREAPSTELNGCPYAQRRKAAATKLKGMSYNGLGFKIDGAGNVAYDWDVLGEYDIRPDSESECSDGEWTESDSSDF